MKITLKVLLVVAALMQVNKCYRIVIGPIEFDI